MESLEDLMSSQIGSFAAAFGSMASGSIKVREFAGGEKMLRRLARFEPLAAAQTFANLLLQPRLQGNAYRAEVLTHLALACGKGTAKVDAASLRYMYNAMNEGWAGRLEDPPEDVFVYPVRCDVGNFRVLEGMWEGNGFHLQLFLDLVEKMPSTDYFDRIRASVLAMVRLSDMLCERAGLARWILGDLNPLDSVDMKRAAKLLVGRNRLRFSVDELANAGIDAVALRPFLFDISDAAELLDRPPAGSPLESRPLVLEGNTLHVMLPTAFSAAIRTFVISKLNTSRNDKALRAGITNTYAKLWIETPLPGLRSHHSIKFEETYGTYWGEVTVEIDVGRHLHFLFVTDPLDDFEVDGLATSWNALALSDEINRRIEVVRQAAQSRDFCCGLTLVVGCGVGRGSAFAFGERDTPGWRAEFISAYDLHTLSWLPEFNIGSLFRLLDQRDEAQRLGLEVMNVNGLLNLIGWSRQLNGHVVPHADLEDGKVTGIMAIDQTALRSVRQDVANATDPQVALDATGRLLRIRRDFDDTFAEDANSPIFVSEDAGSSGKPMTAYIASRHTWWADTMLADDVPGEIAYERWRTVRLWISRVAALLDPQMDLPLGSIQWTAVFDRPSGDCPLPIERMNFDQARAEITVSVVGHVITTKATKNFELAWLNEENVAERALVAALIDGISELVGTLTEQQRCETLERVIDHPLAKQQHGFVARGFRDWMRAALAIEPVMTTREDDALIRLGLGWKVRDRSLGAWVEGQEDCNAFLSALVRLVEDELIANLAGFERIGLVQQLLLNHERTHFDRDLWDRTAASNLALRSDRAATIDTLRNHKFRLNATSIATRLLLELAVCVCPVGKGKTAGDYDLSNLLARMMLVFELGGWSDAIRWGVMVPKLRITPLGDVHGNFDWHDAIVAPFGEKTGHDSIAKAETDYAKNLEELPVKATVDFDPELDAAWLDEFGATFHQTRVFIEHLEDEGRRRDEPVLKLSRSDLTRFSVADEVVEGAAAERLVEKLLLVPRENWRKPPPWAQPKDIFPWRFRRRLSLLRRPLLNVDGDTIIVAPGMLREAFVYMLGNFLAGDFPKEQLSPKMGAWQDKVINEKGRKLAEDTKAKLESDGWTVWIEKKLTELLNMGLDRNYGDVDVLARKGNRVAVIECKDLMYRKTNGEICEQVRDYLGEVRNGRRDELRKHLDRVTLLRSHLHALGKYVGVARLEDVECHLVFRNPTPVVYALNRKNIDVHVHVLADGLSI